MSPYYWSRADFRAEVDFLVESEDDLVPIEVKAERNVKAKSLSVFRAAFSPRLSARTSLSPYSRANGLADIPLYAISTLKNEIACQFGDPKILGYSTTLYSIKDPLTSDPLMSSSPFVPQRSPNDYFVKDGKGFDGWIEYSPLDGDCPAVIRLREVPAVMRSRHL